MAIRKELSLRLPNSPGALGRIAGILGRERVNIVALAVEAGGVVRMVVDNPLRAYGVLEANDCGVEQRDVLVLDLPHCPQALAGAIQLLAAADVNIEYVYASAVEGGTSATVVLGVESIERAAMAGV